MFRLSIISFFIFSLLLSFSHAEKVKVFEFTNSELEKLKVRKLKVCKPPAKAICATVACATHNEIDVQSAPKSAKLALRNRI